MLYASLDSLIGGTTLCEWKMLPSVPDSHCSLAAFGNRLVVIESESVSSLLEEETPIKTESTSPLVDETTSDPYSSAILAYSHHNKSWVHVGDIPPTGEASTYTAVTCTAKGELIVVGSSIHFIVDLKGMLLLFLYVSTYHNNNIIYDYYAETPFIIESCFTLRALHQLEGADIPILSSLKDNIQIFSSIISSIACDDDLTLESVLDSWLMGRSCIRPIWKDLFLILCLLGLDSLGQQIDIYLGKISEQHYEEDNNELIITEG